MSIAAAAAAALLSHAAMPADAEAPIQTAPAAAPVAAPTAYASVPKHSPVNSMPSDAALTLVAPIPMSNCASSSSTRTQGTSPTAVTPAKRAAYRWSANLRRLIGLASST